MKNCFLLFLWLLAFEALAQPVARLDERLDEIQPEMEALVDHGYDLQRILHDTTLRFTPVQASLPPASVYWLRVKVANTSANGQSWRVRAFPHLQNTIYYFHPVVGKWIARQTGIFTPRMQRKVASVTLDFQERTTSIIYVRADLTAAGEVKKPLKARIVLTPEEKVRAMEQRIITAWTVCLAILLLFFLNNLYVYYSFKDSSVGYYLLAQLAGMFYLTSYWQLLRLWLPCTPFSFGLHEELYFYDLNHLVMHAAILAVFFSFVQLTRSYLNTRQTLPKADRALRFALYFYGIFSLVVGGINLSGFYVEYYTLILDNLLCLTIVALIVWTSLLGYLRKLPAASTFLLANVLPLSCMMSIPIYHLLVSYNGFENLWIPVLAIATQALGFSIALVDRTKTIQRDLNLKEIAHRQLEFDLREADIRGRLMESENQKITASHEYQTSLNGLLQQQLEVQQRELVSSTLHMVQKNELLGNLKTEIDDLNKPTRSAAPRDLKNLKVMLENNLQLDADWHKFKMHFEQVHPLFFDSLKEKHPTLTTKETRLYAYFHMNLSHREIAALLNIDPASVRRAKTRLFKKMALSEKNSD